MNQNQKSKCFIPLLFILDHVDLFSYKHALEYGLMYQIRKVLDDLDPIVAARLTCPQQGQPAAA